MRLVLGYKYTSLIYLSRWVWRKWSGPKQLADKKTGTLMMLPCVHRLCWSDRFLISNFCYRTDYVLTQDKSFKKFAKAYADSQDVFFNEYVALDTT